MSALPHIEIAIGPHRLLLSTGGVREVWTGRGEPSGGNMVWRGIRVPLLEGRAMLGLPPQPGCEGACLAHEYEGRIVVLVADAVIGLCQIDPADLRPLPPLPHHTAALVDAAWLGQDGRLRLRLREDCLAPEKELLNAR